MKKTVIIITAALLALSIVFCGFASAATLDSWTILTPFDADGAGKSDGRIGVTTEGFITFDIPVDRWWPQAGLRYNSLVSLAGLEIILNCPAFTDSSPNGYFAVTLSSSPEGNFVPNGGLLNARSPEINAVDYYSVSLNLYAGTRIGFEGLVVAHGNDWGGIASVTPGQDFRITFEKSGDSKCHRQTHSLYFFSTAAQSSTSKNSLI